MKLRLIILLILISIMSLVDKELDKVDKKLQSIVYKGNMSNRARIYSLIGMKKSGADLIGLQQAQNIGETLEGDRSKEIKDTSLEMSQLNPYFLENYYASANVLAFIKVYNDYAGAQEILNRGMVYNPNDEFLKKYSAGLLATSKGDDEGVLKNYEKIVEKYPDPLMVKVIYEIYLEKAKKNKSYLEKYIYYAEILYASKNDKYKKVVEEDLKELGLSQ